MFGRVPQDTPRPAHPFSSGSPCPATSAPRGLSMPFEMHSVPLCAFRCSPGSPVDIPGHTVFLWVHFSAPQKSLFAICCRPGASMCLSVCPQALLGPFGAPSPPHLSFSSPSSLSVSFHVLKTPWLGCLCIQRPSVWLSGVLTGTDVPFGVPQTSQCAFWCP